MKPGVASTERTDRWAADLFSRAEWVPRLLHLNLLWWGYTLCGGVLFGVFPSTVALLRVITVRLRGDFGLSSWSLYRIGFRRHFVRANLFGYATLAAAGLVGIDYLYLATSETEAIRPLRALAVAAAILLVLVAVNLAAVVAIADSIGPDSLRTAALLVVMSPLRTVLAAIAVVTLSVVLFVSLPLVGLIIGIPTIALAVCALVRPHPLIALPIDPVASKEQQQ